MNSDAKALATLAAAVFYAALLGVAIWPLCRAPLRRAAAFCRRRTIEAIVAAVFTGIAVHCGANKATNGNDRAGGSWEVSRGGAEAQREDVVLRDADPAEGLTNFSFTAYAVTPSNESFAAAWPEWMLPYGSRIELHEKLFSLTNGWTPVREYVVEPGQTNLCDTLSITNGHPGIAFKALYGDSISITFPGLPSVVDSATGRRLSVLVMSDGSAPVSLPVAVERSERPAEFPPSDPAFAADPFAHVDGLAYDPTNETVTADEPGVFTMATGDQLCLIAPKLSFGSPHSYSGEGLRSGSSSGSMHRWNWNDGPQVTVPSYPLDEKCLWEGWHEGTETDHGCSCHAELDFGCDISSCTGIVSEVTVEDDTVIAKVFLGESLVWSNSCEHADHSSSGGRSDYLSSDECSSCGTCADGNCDAFDGPSAGSVRFRVSLGSPSEGHVSGFLWFDQDSVFLPTPSSFSLMARHDAHVSDNTAGGTRIVACSDRGGRTIAVSPIQNGVRLTVTFTATGAPDRTWEITRGSGAMRFRKFNAGGVLMSDASYAPSGEACSVTDNVSGLTEVKSSTGDVLWWDNNWSRTVETVSVCGAVTGSHVRVVSEVVGWGDYAVLRETERSEKRADGTWATSHASYWGDYGSRRNGQPRMVWGDDRAWSWANYDELGRETLRFDQRDGSAAPDDWERYSMYELPGCDAFATVTDYVPHAGDSCHTNDFEKPRTVSRYVISDGVATLIACTWTLYAHGVAANGWPTVSETTIRACSQAAAGIDDPGNAVSTVVRFEDETSAVPYLLRGEVVSETDEDGVTETHSHTILSNTVVRTVVSRTKGGHEAKTREVRERDLAYGLTLYEATQLTADPSVEFGWRRHTYDSRRRLRFTQYDDGSSETNAYDCCRLLFRIDRGGAKTLYCSTPETAHLYHAEEEVGKKDWYRGEERLGTAWSRTQFLKGYPAVLHFNDAFGRETNTVKRTAMVEEESTSPNFPSNGGFVTSATVCYPFGTSDCSRAIDERGVVTDTMAIGNQAAATTVSIECAPGAAVASVVTTNVAWRGGGTESFRHADGHFTRSIVIAEYMPDGRRRETSVTESDDCGTVTNAVTEFDFLGRASVVCTPLSCISNCYTGSASRVDSVHDSVSGLSTTNLYDEVGEQFGAVSRGVETVELTDYVSFSDAWWRVVRSFSCADGVTNAATATWTRLTGLSKDLLSEELSYRDDALVSRRTSCMESDGRTVRDETEDPVGGDSVVRRVDGREFERVDRYGHLFTCYNPLGTVSSHELQANTGNSIKNLFGYDVNGFGDTVGLWTFYNSWNDHRMASFEFDCRGNKVRSVDECGNVATNVYDSSGRQLAQWGSQIPVKRNYDSSGRLVSMKTARSGVPSDETRWGYDAETGLCTSKTYADGSFSTNTWTADGLQLRRTNPDGGWTESLYDSARRPVGMESSDPGCAHVLSLDPFGRIVAASCPAAQYQYLLSSNGTATNEVASVAGTSLQISRKVDAFGRLAGLAFGGSEMTHVAYAASGFLSAISNSEAVARYEYNNVGRSTACDLALSNGMVFSFRTPRHSYFRDVVTSATSICGASTNRYSYSYDDLNRPVSRNGVSFAYDGRGQVVRENRGSAADSYSYDDAGNLVVSTREGVSSQWTANDLNQYVAISTGGATEYPGYTANGEMSHLDGLVLAYDAKSRLVAAGEWVFDDERYLAGDYDDYDELYSFEPIVSNRYDHLDRRVQKITPAATHTYFYDGWMLIKEIVANTNGTTDLIEYHWGKDLSASIGGAGGVGGLLYLKRNGVIYVPFYDAYGNVMGYWDAQGNVVAEYTYDAFGKLVASSGPMAEVFSFRYSTKYFDPETGFYYYGYRYYSPELMRWITRDPIGEEGGVNLYAMCGNNSLTCVDLLGLISTGIPQHSFFNDTKKRKGFKIASFVDVKLKELRKIKGTDYFWRVAIIPRFSPPHEVELRRHKQSKVSKLLWGDANMSLGGERGMYEPIDSLHDIPSLIWGDPSVVSGGMSNAGVALGDTYHYDNKKFRFGYVVYMRHGATGAFTEYASNLDMYNTWSVGGLKKLIPDDEISILNEHARCKDTVLILYGDIGYQPQSMQFEVR